MRVLKIVTLKNFDGCTSCMPSSPKEYISPWHMPVETAKCWWLLKIEPNAWAGGNGSCAVFVDLQAVGALEFFGGLAKGFGPFLRGVWTEGSIFSNHQHFAISTGICGVACPLPASRVDKPLFSILHMLTTILKA